MKLMCEKCQDDVLSPMPGILDQVDQTPHYNDVQTAQLLQQIDFSALTAAESSCVFVAEVPAGTSALSSKSVCAAEGMVETGVASLYTAH